MSSTARPPPGRKVPRSVTTILQVIAVAAIVFGVVIAVTGRGRGFDDVEPDLADNRLPAGEIGPRDVEEVKFSLAFRGYRMEEVDDALDRIAEELARRDRLIADLRRGGSPDEALESPAERWGADAQAAGHSPAEIPVEVAPLPADVLLPDDLDDEQYDEYDEGGESLAVESLDVDVDEDDLEEDDLDDQESDDAAPYAAAQASLGGAPGWIEQEEPGQHVDDVADAVAEHQIGVAPLEMRGHALDLEPEPDDDDDEPAELADPDAGSEAETAPPPATYADERAETPDALEQPDDRPGSPLAVPEDDNPYRPKLPPFFQK